MYFIYSNIVSFNVNHGLILNQTVVNGADNTALIDGLMHIILDIRATAKANKDWATSDKIRDALKEAGVTVKDGKDGATYSF